MEYSIVFGFCTNAGLGNRDNFKHPESAYYYSNGGFRKEGKWEEGFPKAAVGDVICCEADLASGVLRWHKNGEMLVE
jgi:hypothetical protein